MSSTTDPVQALRAALVGQPVDGAWLFGSAATETMGPLSDVDVGILPRPTVSDRDRMEIISIVDDAAVKGWDVERVDVVFLDEAPPVLGFEIIKGQRFYVADEEACMVAEARAASRYHDRLPYIERHRAELLKRYKAGVFG